MHEVHYDYIKNKYDNKLGFFFTDTDSWMYEIENKEVFLNLVKIQKCLIKLTFLLN